jgi:predicted O-linked N-acetylglucosamine transferase (SPINDLY family)
MGYPDCVAGNTEQYTDIAVTLGTDRERREHVMDMISRRCPVLFEDKQAVREHERLFGLMLDAV